MIVKVTREMLERLGIAFRPHRVEATYDSSKYRLQYWSERYEEKSELWMDGLYWSKVSFGCLNKRVDVLSRVPLSGRSERLERAHQAWLRMLKAESEVQK